MKLSTMKIAACLAVLLAAGWTGLALPAMAQEVTAAVPAAPASTPAASTVVPGYRLGTGDKVRLTVFGEPELSGEFEVDGSGYLRLNLIGQVKGAGLTVGEFERSVKALLEDGYLKDARVSVDVINYRPF